MKLIVLDIDGVLSGGESQPFDLSLLKRLAELNRRARRNKEIPAVTLNTGRPSPYVEAVMQAIDGWQPALFESGAGLYFPTTYQFQKSPVLTPAHEQMLGKIVAMLDQELVQSGQAYWQPGKSVYYSLFPRAPFTITEITATALELVSGISEQFTVTPAIKVLNIHPVGINKGEGLRWLAQVTGIELVGMGGVGDSMGDIEFLRIAGYSAAPENAIPEVKAVVDYVSAQPTTAGLKDILRHWSIF